MHSTAPAATSGYKQLKKGSQIFDSEFKVGDLVRIKEGPETAFAGEERWISNLRTTEATVDNGFAICLTDIPPDKWPKGHIAHGHFYGLSQIELAFEPVTPQEEAEVLKSILGSSDD